MMSTFTVRRILDNHHDDYEAAVAAMTDAFDDEIHRPLLEGTKKSVERLMRVHLNAALIGGELIVAELRDIGVIGVATCFGPTEKFLSTEEQRNAGYNQLLADLSPVQRDWWNSRYMEHTRNSEIKLATYYLQSLGVAPQYQRRGAAKALMKYFEAKAQDAGVDATLETAGERNIAVYTALGYKTASTYSLTSPVGKVVDFVIMAKHPKTD